MTRDEADLSHITETDKAYLAGFIDGEGHLGVKTSPYFYPLVEVTQAIEKPIQELHKLWGVGYLSSRPNSGFNARMLYKWTIRAAKAANLLKEVLPYLVIKRTQAEGLLALQDNIDEHRHLHKLPEEVLEYRAWIKQKVSELNRGVLEYDS